MKKWRKREGEEVEEKAVVLVAVEGTREITDYALEWAVRNVVQPQDTLILLALVSISPLNNQSTVLPHFFSSLFKKWGNGSGVGSSNNSNNKESSMQEEHEIEIERVNEICAEMMNELCSHNNIKHVQTLVKLIPQTLLGSVAASAEEHQANWVILDRRLKRESESCLRRLNSNIILIDHAIPKILQLNRQAKGIEKVKSEGNQSYFDDSLSTTSSQSTESFRSSSTSTVTSLSTNTSEKDTSTPHTPPSRLSQSQQLFRPKHNIDHRHHRQCHSKPAVSSVTEKSNMNNPNINILKDTLQEKLNINTSTNKPSLPMGSEMMDKKVSEVLLKKMNTSRSTSTPPAARRLSVDTRTQVDHQISSQERPTETSRQQWAGGISCRTFRDGSKIQQRPSSTLRTRPPVDRTSSIRRHISLSIKQPHTPPPLCSVCKHAAPVFGRPPRKFSYEEIQKATNVFSPSNYLAEGGFGPVYKGMLEDGQVVAVKKHKKASAQGAAEFCSEVEVLSCAQHRNLVMLVGYCMDQDWLLVYEYACYGSLDKHLYGIHAKEVMPWHQRQKVAVGAARGLRYLHEDCRVGCIIHRDLRPNNILLTHDFEPMVGDFGLARWQADGQSAEETRIVGTFGYLAPEYTQTGQITEKADVYAFGVLLLELISGVKAIDLARGTGQQYLPQWAQVLMEMNMIQELIDPRLNGKYVKWEVECMIYASSLCILPDPEMRPRMSKVLRILEGDMGSKLPAIIPQQHVSMPQFAFPPYHQPPVPLQSSHHHHHSIPLFKPTTRPSHPQIQQYPRAFNEVDLIDQTGNTLKVHNQNENSLKEEYKEYLQGLFDEFLHKARHLSSLSTGDSVTQHARRIY